MSYVAPMLSTSRIEQIAADAARKQVAAGGLERVLAEPATDSDGKEAVRITLVVTPKTATSLTGDQALDLLIEVQNRIQEAGDERFPIIEYATEQELLSGGLE